MRKYYVSFILFLCFKFCINKKYYNYRLYRGIAVNDSQLEFFKSLDNRFDINFWKPPGLLNKPIDFVINPDNEISFLRQAAMHSIHLTTLIEDVQKVFDMQTVKHYTRTKISTFDWNNYYRLDDIYQWLRDLSRTYPKHVELYLIGKTHENRDIVAVRVLPFGCMFRSKVIIEGGIHAREWISPAFVTYFISQILNASKSEDPALRNIALTYEWYFVPVLNPDGYEYTHTENRLWRKNRKDSGVDLNRNFDIAYGRVGVSYYQYSEVYAGAEAFSEHESKAMAKFVESKSANLEYYISFHSYGQYMIIPYGYSARHMDNYDQVAKMCSEAASKIADKYKTRYTYGTAYDTVGYAASGISACWVKKTFNVPYVITFELRDTGNDGFALRPDKILPTCKETMDGLISFLTPRTKKYQKFFFNDTLLYDGGRNNNVMNNIVIGSYVGLIILRLL